MKIGIVGTGNISTFLLDQVKKNNDFEGEVVAIFGRNQEAGMQLSERFGVEFHIDFETFLESAMDIVVEAATGEAVRLYAKDILGSDKDLIVSSIGAFSDIQFLDEISALTKKNGRHMYLPSGAIGGLDLLKSANALNGLKRVQITTRKSPASLGMDGDCPEEILFEGSAREAIQRFPKNVNVALVLALAGIGVEKTGVRVIADPAIARNTHTIEAEGSFGYMHLKVENNPMPTNPKTSLLAALSILAALQNKEDSVKIGS